MATSSDALSFIQNIDEYGDTIITVRNQAKTLRFRVCRAVLRLWGPVWEAKSSIDWTGAILIELKVEGDKIDAFRNLLLAAHHQRLPQHLTIRELSQLAQLAIEYKTKHVVQNQVRRLLWSLHDHPDDYIKHEDLASIWQKYMKDIDIDTDRLNHSAEDILGFGCDLVWISHLYTGEKEYEKLFDFAMRLLLHHTVPARTANLCIPKKCRDLLLSKLFSAMTDICFHLSTAFAFAKDPETKCIQAGNCQSQKSCAELHLEYLKDFMQACGILINEYGQVEIDKIGGNLRLMFHKVETLSECLDELVCSNHTFGHGDCIPGFRDMDLAVVKHANGEVKGPDYPVFDFPP